MNSPKDQYPNALEVIRRIINLTRDEDCIFRGESALYEHPCSSTLYRELKRVNATPRSIPRLLKQKQNRLIEQMRPHDDEGKNDLERLMACQHKGAKTNLLDFTGDHAVALFFACFDDENEDEDGQVLIKQKGMFPKLETERDELSNDETVLLEPPKRLRRAKDQKGVLVHVPNGSLPVVEGETVVIKAEWKQEIVEYLEKAHQISHETLFDDIEGVIERQDREIKQNASELGQASTRLEGFAKPKDNRNSLIMEYYVRLSGTPLEGFYRELLVTHANTLIASFTDILKRNPQYAGAYFNRALVYQSKPDPEYEKAILDYTHAIAIGFNFNYVEAEAYNNRGVAYMAKPDPDYERAISDFSRTTELSPNYAGAYYNRGIAHADKLIPDHDQSISDYTRAIELDPNYAKAYNNRGNMHTRKSKPRYAQAIADYNRAIELDPNYARAYLNRGVAYMDKPDPDYDRALSDCTRAIELNPNFAGSYNVRGEVYVKIKKPDYDRALSDFTRTIELNPDYTEAYHNRGVTYTKKPDPDYDRAIVDFTMKLKLNPNPATYCSRGAAYADKPKPDYARAISDFTNALDLNSDMVEAYYGRGIVHSKDSIRDYDRAILDFTRVIELNPDMILAYHNRARAYITKQGPDYDKAIEDYTQIISRTPNNVEAYCGRGFVYAARGDFISARRDYNEALKINPRMAKIPRFIEFGKYLESKRE